ncbi:Trans-aconitate 2-methyltransferase [bioreactor metagenome]|uniref:Trans-aconitate 2-methyltransferase n=1 Tax=bioreactor metagenome TaxID=1076179 RepID=A0A644X5F8_9ZZZZ|nr:methyltransferase domain-containing protein [Lachnospiraceae bacterium]MEA5092169.1 methyltransferase domain-containing protein [Acidaminococcaceae bacterium]
MWSADMYGKFEKERKQPSIDLLNKIDGGKFERIIDIGCGSGMSTLTLKKRFTESEIVGVDLSENMLDKARRSISGVTWMQRDCSRKLNDLGTFDLVFSNAFIQWIPNQEEFIKNTKELLNENGVFAIQIPYFEEMKVAKIIKEVSLEFDTNKALFGNLVTSTYFNYNFKEYYDMFSRYYSNIDIWKTNYIHQMKDCNAIVDFIKGTALLPYLECLDEKQTTLFIKKLYDKISECYVASENGTVLFEFKRLFIIARK